MRYACERETELWTDCRQLSAGGGLIASGEDEAEAEAEEDAIAVVFDSCVAAPPVLAGAMFCRSTGIIGY